MEDTRLVVFKFLFLYLCVVVFLTSIFLFRGLSIIPSLRYFFLEALMMITYILLRLLAIPHGIRLVYLYREEVKRQYNFLFYASWSAISIVCGWHLFVYWWQISHSRLPFVLVQLVNFNLMPVNCQSKLSVANIALGFPLPNYSLASWSLVYWLINF